MPKFLNSILKILLFAFVSGALLLLGLIYYYSKDLPDYSALQNYHPPAVTRIYSADGKLIEEYAKEYRIFVPIENIPKSLIEAFLAAEDRNFYEHYGVDIPGVIRAAFANVGRILKGKRMEGASTITQQVVKNFFLNSEQSIARKVKEAVLSYRISRTFTKNQILELYLNQMYLGKGAYGVAAASQAYFNKTLNELTLPEAALLAALPKAPSTFNPEKKYERVFLRRNYVISRMIEDGYVTQEAGEEAMASPITLIKRDKAETITADYYAETVRTQIIELLGKEMFYGGGLTVITSMNTKYQEQADKSLVYGIREYDMKKGYRGPIAKISLDNWQDNLKNLPKPNGLREFELAVILSLDEKTAIIGLEDGNKASLSINDMKWTATNLTSLRKIMKVGDVVAVTNINKKGYQLRQIPAVNGAIMVMNPETGQVLALVGGYDFSASKFNRATQALRQPGSSIKPIVYLAALENGLLPTDLYEDAPSSFSQGKGMPAWKPKNYKGDFLGTITMRKALEKSRNIVTAKISERIGVERVAEIIQRFGINSKPPHYISMCLGALETTVDKMASAYSAIANGGYKVTPQYIEVIKDSNGKIIYKRDSGSCNCETGANPPVISHSPVLRLSDEASIYQITSLMEGSVQRGTSQGSKKLGKIIAGKTGTTNDSMDTWFIGFTPKITVATYIGHDTPKDLGKSATGATVALPVFVDFMSQAYKDEPSIPFKIPNSIATFKVDPVTGKRSDSEGAILEAFKVSETENIPAIEVDVKPNRTIIENDSGIY